MSSTSGPASCNEGEKRGQITCRALVPFGRSGLESSRQPTFEVGLEKDGFTEHVSAFENRRGYVREYGS